MKNLMLFTCLLAAGTVMSQQTHRLAVENDVFTPEFLVVEAGDPIELWLSGHHTLTQVTAATFRSGGHIPNGGLHIGTGTAFDGELTTFSLRDPGEYYFVSEGSQDGSAKTKIIVIGSSNTGISSPPDQHGPRVYPNPADDQVRFAAHEHLDMMSVQAFDQGGRLVLQAVIRGNEPLNIMALPSGLYTLRLTDGMSKVYGVERLVINRDLGGL
jgi:plastocyanin